MTQGSGRAPWMYMGYWSEEGRWRAENIQLLAQFARGEEGERTTLSRAEDAEQKVRARLAEVQAAGAGPAEAEAEQARLVEVRLLERRLTTLEELKEAARQNLVDLRHLKEQRIQRRMDYQQEFDRLEELKALAGRNLVAAARAQLEREQREASQKAAAERAAAEQEQRRIEQEQLSQQALEAFKRLNLDDRKTHLTDKFMVFFAETQQPGWTAEELLDVKRAFDRLPWYERLQLASILLVRNGKGPTVTRGDGSSGVLAGCTHGASTPEQRMRSHGVDPDQGLNDVQKETSTHIHYYDEAFVRGGATWAGSTLLHEVGHALLRTDTSPTRGQRSNWMQALLRLQGILHNDIQLLEDTQEWIGVHSDYVNRLVALHELMAKQAGSPDTVPMAVWEKAQADLTGAFVELSKSRTHEQELYRDRVWGRHEAFLRDPGNSAIRIAVVDLAAKLERLHNSTVRFYEKVTIPSQFSEVARQEGFRAPTAYAKTNPSEFFAESYSLFRATDEAAQRYPAVAKWLNDALKSKLWSADEVDDLIENFAG